METKDTLDAPVIRAEGLGKRFRIGMRSEKESFLATTRRLLTGGADQRELWALRGVSFQVGRGEALGVIGPNGAGKSTLLMLLSQILSPTEGCCRTSGKAHCFFRIGTALQPRLTVLENFSLCSALLGLDREEFRARLPSMISFSGLGDYLYAKYGELSSGLAARLPFSAAVHTDLDIILVDEMLMVGDRAFQAKCLKTFHDFKAQGKTLVIVSHSLPLIESLCQRALYLNAGRQVFIGESGEAVRRMVEDIGGPAAAPVRPHGTSDAGHGFAVRLQVPKIAAAFSRRMAFELGASGEELSEDWGEGIRDSKARELIDSEVRRLAPELRKAARKGASAPKPAAAPKEPLRDQIRRDVEAELAKMRNEMRSCLEEYGERTIHSQPPASPVPASSREVMEPEQALSAWRELLGHEGPLEICASRQAALGAVLSALSDPVAGNGAMRGDEVVLSPITWPWVIRGISSLGFKPVFADVSPKNFNLDPDSLRAACGPRTKAVLLSHNGNNCAEIEGIAAVCEERGLRMISCTCLSALGCLYNGRFVGIDADLGLIFPLNPKTHWSLAFSRRPESAEAFGKLLLPGSAYDENNPFLPIRAYDEFMVGSAKAAVHLKLQERQIRDPEAFASYTGFFRAYGDFFDIPKPPKKAKMAPRFFVMLLRDEVPFSSKDIPGLVMNGENRRTVMGGYGRHFMPPESEGQQTGSLPNTVRLVERSIMFPLVDNKRQREEFFDLFAEWMKKWEKPARSK